VSTPVAPFRHPTAIIEEGVELGEGAKVWDNVHIRRGARVGKSTIVGEKTYIAYDVRIGDFVKINACVYICAAVTVEDFCMISAHTVFTNDRFPRAGNRDLTGLETSDPTEETLATRVCRGVTIGANATIGPGVTLGEFSMVGMGSVVTKDVAPYSLVVGNPARPAGWVCVCGRPLVRGAGARPAAASVQLTCDHCHRKYFWDASGFHAVAPGGGR
jgi:UDP-2-acetamido-3-amino-2,3-dideoxy-glucuronate N-acetyltransferase